MYDVRLLVLADRVGLSQSAIAAHFGINRAQVNRWARGHRPIPQHFLCPLTDLVFQAAKRCLAQLSPQGWITIAELGFFPTKEELRAEITALLNICEAEHAERHGEGPSAGVDITLALLEGFQRMTPADRCKPANAFRLTQLAADLYTHSQGVLQISPVLDLINEEHLNANGHSQLDESGDVSGADTRH